MMATSNREPDYAERRRRLIEDLGGDGVLVLPASPEIVVGRGLELPYRPDADLLYLTGYDEPEAVLLLGALDNEERCVLFVRPRDPEIERWSGVRRDPESIAAELGLQVYPLPELEERLTPILAAAERIYFPLDSGRPEVEAIVYRALVGSRRLRQRKGRGPRSLSDPGVLLDELRLIKDKAEIALIAEAGRITVESLLEIVPAIRPGAGEWEVEAALEAAFRRRGALGPAFASIIASGPNATILHYIENQRTMRAGELLLIDAGAQWRGYNADISRTLPVSGRFRPEQREVYDAVVRAHSAAIAEVRPGATIGAVHERARAMIIEALLEFGLLEGSTEEIIESGLYRPFFPHQTSHWLGLDVHDVGDYMVEGESRELEPGMVLTIEPGLYFAPTDGALPEAFRGIGVRVEDDILVTADGHEVLTPGLPTTAEEVEALFS